MSESTLDILLQVEEALRFALGLIDDHKVKGFADLHIQHALDIVQEQMVSIRSGVGRG